MLPHIELINSSLLGRRDQALALDESARHAPEVLQDHAAHRGAVWLMLILEYQLFPKCPFEALTYLIAQLIAIYLPCVKGLEPHTKLWIARSQFRDP